MENVYDLNDEMSEDDIHGIVESQTSEVKSKRIRRCTSSVWDAFERIEENGVERAKCKNCGVKYMYDSKKSGTSNLKRHIDKCPRREADDIGQMILSQSSGAMMVRQNKIEQDVFREKMAMAIIRHDYPFSFVEHEGFRDLCSYLNPDVKHISRNTAKADVLKLHKKHKDILRQKLLSCPGRICLTSDMWTSITTDGYINLTAHFIDKDWILRKYVLNFSVMPPPHSGLAISEKVSFLLNDWGIENKIFSITLDNASANDVFVQVMKNKLRLKNSLLSDGKYLHVRCCAHILNLIVQEGLKVLNEAVHKIRETVKYLKGSQVRKARFLDCISELSMTKKKGLRQDVPTRWNSTFFMLDSCLSYHRALCQLQLVDTSYNDCPTSEEWKQVDRLCQFLKVFYDVTNIFSGTKYPTSNLYFHGVWKIQMHLKKESETPDWFMGNLVQQMQKKFDKYWKEYSSVLAMAVVFDPRYKLQFVEFRYKKLYGENFKMEVDRVNQNLHSLYEEYSQHVRKEPGRSNPSSSSIDDGQFSFLDDQMDDIQEFVNYKSQNTQNHLSQLDLYLQEPNIHINQDLDILQFWKSYEYRYPELSMMVRDILTIPISTVASESAFSIGGRVLNPNRSCLIPENVEALITTRDWLFGMGVDYLEMKTEDMVEDILENENSNLTSSAVNIGDI